MARVKPRSNIYAFLPFVACLIMGLGIGFTWVRIQDYRGPEPPPDPLPLMKVAEHLRPEQPKPLEPEVEQPPLGEEEEAPGAPIEEDEGTAPPGGGEEEGGVVAPPGGGVEEEPKEPEEEER